MAVASRGRVELPKQQWKERETSPERTKVWTEPKLRTAERRVAVVYYLSRNGHLEHPHFMEVSLSSSSDGLYLRDVINRLNLLRGKGMANMYSWSSKRSYKNGFVWHDLSDDDFIYPAHGHEYVLKGSELLYPAADAAASSGSQDTTASSSSSERPLEIPRLVEHGTNFPLAAATRKKTPWKSFDLNEYKVYKNELTAEAAVKAADASTQTDDRRQRRRALVREEERAENPSAEEENPTTELGRDEISPPPSSSSPETLESLIRADGRLIPIRTDDQDRTVGSSTSGRIRASAMLMHLLSCGSFSVKDDHDLVSQYRRRLPRAASEMEGLSEMPSFPAVRLEDKEYFSGSLIETKKKGADGPAEFPGLKRSSSYNADRSSKLELAEKEIEGVRAKCIPRKPKTTARKEANPAISRSTHGINDEPPQK